jgi:hypothetical protein
MDMSGPITGAADRVGVGAPARRANLRPTGRDGTRTSEGRRHIQGSSCRPRTVLRSSRRCTRSGCSCERGGPWGARISARCSSRSLHRRSRTDPPARRRRRLRCTPRRPVRRSVQPPALAVRVTACPPLPASLPRSRRSRRRLLLAAAPPRMAPPPAVSRPVAPQRTRRGRRRGGLASSGSAIAWPALDGRCVELFYARRLGSPSVRARRTSRMPTSPARRPRP